MSLFAFIHAESPVPQSRARVTRFGTFYGKKATAHRQDLAWQLKAAFAGPPLAGPLAVRIAVSGAPVTSDLDNHAKMVLDALQDAGVIASDDLRTVAEIVVRRVDGEPGTCIDIQPFVSVSFVDAMRAIAGGTLGQTKEEGAAAVSAPLPGLQRRAARTRRRPLAI